MDPEEVKKGRILTWAVILVEAAIAFCVMLWLASMDPGTLNLDAAEMEGMPEADQKLMRSISRENFRAISQANVAGPIYFVVVLGMCLALLGGNWWVRVGFAVFLMAGAAATLACPWIVHPAVLKPTTGAIIFAVLLSLIHSAGGVILLFAAPVKYFLHPRRMMFAAIPEHT